MRSAALAIFVVGALSAPVHAQTYGANYPVCLQVFGRFPHFECGFISIAQCQPSAVGIAAQCVVNPYYIPPRGAAPRVRHRHRSHVY